MQSGQGKFNVFPIHLSTLPSQQEQIKGSELETREKDGDTQQSVGGEGVVGVGCPVAPSAEEGFAPKQSGVGNGSVETTKGTGSLTDWFPFLAKWLVVPLAGVGFLDGPW